MRGLELEKEYTLTERRAPDTYAEAESIPFKLVQTGSEQTNDVFVKSGDTWEKLDDGTVIMKDAPALDIDKTDVSGNLLPGATLTIRAEDGTVVDTWVTDYKTHRVPISDESILLSDDITENVYTLTEDAALMALKSPARCSSRLCLKAMAFCCMYAKFGRRMDAHRQTTHHDD